MTDNALDVEIAALRDDQRDAQHRLEDQIAVELRAMADQETARRLQVECRKRVKHDAAEIDSRLDRKRTQAAT